jgi:hypothetical protein
MADDPKKNPTQTPGQESEPRQKGQQDIPKKNSFPQDQNEERDDQQQGDKRRAS